MIQGIKQILHQKELLGEYEVDCTDVLHTLSRARLEKYALFLTMLLARRYTDTTLSNLIKGKGRYLADFDGMIKSKGRRYLVGFDGGEDVNDEEGGG